MIDNRRFIAEVNENVDILEMDSILNKDIKSVLEVLSTYKDFDIEKVFQYKLYANSKLVDPELYDIDYKNHTLTNKSPISNVTYTIVLYGNIERLNQINDLILANKRYRIHKILNEITDKGK